MISTKSDAASQPETDKSYPHFVMTIFERWWHFILWMDMSEIESKTTARERKIEVKIGVCPVISLILDIEYFVRFVSVFIEVIVQKI